MPLGSPPCATSERMRGWTPSGSRTPSCEHVFQIFLTRSQCSLLQRQCCKSSFLETVRPFRVFWMQLKLDASFILKFKPAEARSWLAGQVCTRPCRSKV